MNQPAIKCKRSYTITDDPLHAVNEATYRAAISGRRYGIFSAGRGKFRISRVAGNPPGALEIVRPNWSYDEQYRRVEA